jgi:hypothetical protein
VEQQLSFTLPQSDAEEVKMITRRGSQLLHQLPGVREVIVSEKCGEGSAPAFCWQIELCSEEAASALQHNQEFLNFSRRFLKQEGSPVTSACFHQRRVA